MKPILAVSYNALTRYSPTHILSSQYAVRTLCGLTRYLPDADASPQTLIEDGAEKSLCARCLKIYRDTGFAG